MRFRYLIALAALAGSAAPAAAQYYYPPAYVPAPGPYAPPGAYVPYGPPAYGAPVMLPPGEVRAIVRNLGYWRVGRPALTGRTYFVTAATEAGPVLLGVDAFTGRVQPVGPADPTRGIGQPPYAAPPLAARSPTPPPLPKPRPTEIEMAKTDPATPSPADAPPPVNTVPGDSGADAPPTAAPQNPPAPEAAPAPAQVVAAEPQPTPPQAAAPAARPTAPVARTGAGTATPGDVPAGIGSVVSPPK
ncbi:hypothetical protein [Aquabacter spiritensis]|uniref:Nickel/cobalt transporter regulator n=1 Tax=Aquabacter spiritensis TaxID=933073 RepID=A0A4R3M4C8_9HYPH|nr:hypothetical protein [Aquabacter spiritensis]TCT08164.1 hypothetical protein EDC64_101686 [Aquabacter spiritensis]